MKTRTMAVDRATKVGRGMVVAIAAAGAVLMLQSSASAHTYAMIPGGVGYAESLRVQDDIFQGCDTAANNIGVYGRFWLNDLSTVIDVADSNGSSGGCGVRDYSATPYWAWGLQGIQRDGKASPKINTDGVGGS